MRSARVMMVVAGLVSIGSTSRADEPTEADRAAIEKLASTIIERIDGAKALPRRRSKAEVAEQRAREALDAAEKSAIVAEVSVNEYLQGTFPQEEQTLLGNLKLAESDLTRATDRAEWSEKMRERGFLTESSILADKMSRQNCEITLANARKQIVILQKFTKPKQVSELEANARKARAEFVVKQSIAVAAKEAVADFDRRVAETALTELERKAIVAIDDAIATFDAGDLAKGREGLASVETLWREAQSARPTERFRSITAKIRAEANAVRAAK